MLYIKEVEEAKKQAEKDLADELSLKSFAKKGVPGKSQNPKKDQKAKSPAHDAETASGSDSRVKEQLSHSNRQLQAMANSPGPGSSPTFRQAAKPRQQREGQQQRQR